MIKGSLSGTLLAALLGIGLIGTGCASNCCKCGMGKDGMMKHHDKDEEKGEKGEKESDETPVKLEELPAPVKDTLTKEAGTGKIGDIDKEAKDGKTQYEADVTMDGKEWELKIGDDGKLISKKMEDDKDEKKEDKDDK